MNLTANISVYTTQRNQTYSYQKKELNFFYVACEILVAVVSVVGNALVILVFKQERRLRRRTNYYIVSLATADLLVGLLGIPFAIMSSVGLPDNLYACLFTVSLLVVLCTISIFCLVAVSVDRYWAILYPMGYSRNVRTKTALVIISLCWFAGSVVGFLPLMGWHHNRPPQQVNSCFFLSVMDYNYLVFLYFGTIITPACLLLGFYAHIYSVVLKQLRQKVVMNPNCGSSAKGISSGGMVRMLGVQQSNEVKATQNLAIIVLFFMICWIPLYTINCIIAFNDSFEVPSIIMLSCIILSHLNSAGNPLLYAYHLRDFRAALKSFLCKLFHIEQNYSDQFPSRYAFDVNSSRYRARNLSYQHRITLDSNFGPIVKKTAVIAAAPTETVGKIWNIIEDSGNCSDSHESVAGTSPKAVEEDDSAPKAYLHSSLLEGDGFTVETTPHDSDLDRSDQPHHSGEAFTYLTTKEGDLDLFIVENDSKYCKKISCVSASTKAKDGDQLNISDGANRRYHRLRFVSNMFKSKKKLKRSASDDGNYYSKKLKKVIMMEYYSVN